MITPVPHRHCMTCDKMLKGRTDKKFCDDYCRNTFNNQQNAMANNLVRKVNNALSKNRRILEALLGPEEKKKKVHREQLLESGFRFRYCTHQHPAGKGPAYTCCYDYAYAATEGDWYWLVKIDPGEK